VLGGGNATVYAEEVNLDGTLGKVLVVRTRGPVVETAVAHSAEHTVTKDGMTDIITLYNGERVEGVPGSAELIVMHFDEHTVSMQAPLRTDGLRNLDAESRKGLQSFMDKVTRAALQWHVTLPCP
jgi:hypothetical protein